MGYYYEKCYIGFCTPRRTQMEFKKKKKEYAVASIHH